VSGISLTDSSTLGGLPAACPALPAPFPAAATYTCTWSSPIVAGTTSGTASASLTGSATVTASTTVTGRTWTHLPTGSKLGLPAAPGTYTAATKVSALGKYVSWQSNLGVDAAGKLIEVFIARKNADLTWTQFAKVSGRTADATGLVTYSRREFDPAWVSVRFWLDTPAGSIITTSIQARWR
jgi:hypothetical protein